jgi:hypothetical protein
MSQVKNDILEWHNFSNLYEVCAHYHRTFLRMFYNIWIGDSDNDISKVQEILNEIEIKAESDLFAFLKVPENK